MSLKIDFAKDAKVPVSFTVKSTGEKIRFWFETFGSGPVCVITVCDTNVIDISDILLQVLDKSGSWHNAESVDDCFFLLEHDLGFRIKYKNELIVNATSCGNL